jgi:hypothetical protein
MAGYVFGREVTIKLPEPIAASADVIAWLDTLDFRHLVTAVPGSGVVRKFGVYADVETGKDYPVKHVRQAAAVLLAAADYAESGQHDV